MAPRVAEASGRSEVLSFLRRGGAPSPWAVESFVYAIVVVAMGMSGLCAANGKVEVVSERFGWGEG